MKTYNLIIQNLPPQLQEKKQIYATRTSRFDDLRHISDIKDSYSSCDGDHELEQGFCTTKASE
jgi:hypothetical protein